MRPFFPDVEDSPQFRDTVITYDVFCKTNKAVQGVLQKQLGLSMASETAFCCLHSSASPQHTV